MSNYKIFTFKNKDELDFILNFHLGKVKGFLLGEYRTNKLRNELGSLFNGFEGANRNLIWYVLVDYNTGRWSFLNYEIMDEKYTDLDLISPECLGAKPISYSKRVNNHSKRRDTLLIQCYLHLNTQFDEHIIDILETLTIKYKNTSIRIYSDVGIFDDRMSYFYHNTKYYLSYTSQDETLLIV